MIVCYGATTAQLLKIGKEQDTKKGEYKNFDELSYIINKHAHLLMKHDSSINMLTYWWSMTHQ